MEELIQRLFQETLQRFRNEKHEFDEESEKILQRVYNEAFRKGFETGCNTNTASENMKS